mmetsp:Transcript_5580/g.11622  ORF Transcript_5580/g.11622 Transcript_5580/m.11622 type:complete len:92 (+) Transcript_5580:1017-1292(+)
MITSALFFLCLLMHLGSHRIREVTEIEFLSQLDLSGSCVLLSFFWLAASLEESSIQERATRASVTVGISHHHHDKFSINIMEQSKQGKVMD